MDDASLDEAYAARRSGNVGAAVQACRRMLDDDHANPGAKSLLGLCLAETGDLDEGRPLIEEALAFEPGNWRFLLNLSVLRELERRDDEAIQSAREAAAAAPERFEPWARVGELCGRRGDFEGAAAALEEAVALEPNHPAMALLLAAAAYEAGRYELAASALDKVEQVAPGRPEVLRLRTHLARRRGAWDEAIEQASRWLAADPSAQEARVALAYSHSQQDDFHAAVEIYRPLVEAHPGDADHAATFAQYLLWSRDFDSAEQFYSLALEANPRHAAASAGLARLNIYKGRFGEAAELARRAIESDPGNVDAYSQLLLADAQSLSNEDLARLQAVAADSAIDAERRAIACFTIGDIHHRRRDHDRAFAAWKAANEVKRDAVQSAGGAYDRAATEQLVDRLIASFGTVPAGSLRASGGPQPIFIVGMPRAGTTLLDSALGAHGDISSGGELPAMPSLLSDFLAWAEGAGWQGGPIPGAIAEQLRDSYLRQYADYRIEPARFVTDKQPLNFLSVGLIRHLFPDAPVIHIRRNPLETGFSIYRNNFTKSWSFSTSLADIGHYYGQYARLMKHWESVFGDGLASVDYERLVEDFEGELRRLLAYAGLEWDEGCLSYFQREGVVTTLSSAQVRKPPSPEMMSSTAPYLTALQPLKEALEQAGVDVPGQ